MKALTFDMSRAQSLCNKGNQTAERPQLLTYQVARVLHAAAVNHLRPTVAALFLTAQTITSLAVQGETSRCSRPATGTVTSRDEVD